jgi:apolipoprotein A1/A4/E domain-containing protein
MGGNKYGTRTDIMANNPRKMQDPTEAALSAIQDALSLRDGEPSAAAEPPPALPGPDPVDRTRENRRRSRRDAARDQEVFFGEPSAAEPEAAEDAQPPAANDDRQSVGRMLQTLQRRPSRRPYVIAGIFAVGWIAAGIMLGMAQLGTEPVQLIGENGIALQLYGFAAVLIMPVAFLFLLANLVSRAQELRIIGRSMTDTAVRFAEPETIAKESIVSVGQAIRREVAAMGDGVERALARAAELEALVHNEVAALERAYNDNELRIRGLIEDLANQRDAMVTQAEQVRNAISGVHVGLTQDIGSVSELIAASVTDAAQRITRSLAEKGEHITLALGRAGDSMIDAIGERGGDLLEQLNTTSAETTRTLESATERLTSSIHVKTDHISEEFGELATKLSNLLSSRLDQVADGFTHRTTGLTAGIAEKAQDITDALIETGGRIAENIATRAEDVNNTLKATGESLVLDLTLRGSDVVSKLDETGSRVTEAIVARSATVTETFRETADTLASTINVKGDAIQELLTARLQSFEDVFTRGGSELAEKISQDSGALGELITRHLSEFDHTVKVYGGELVERLGYNSAELTEKMRSHVENFDDRVTTRATEFTAGLDQRIARVQEALDTRTQTLNQALGNRVLDIAKTLAEGGKEVVGVIEQRIGDIAATINARGTKVADALAAKTDEIDKTLGVRAMEIAGNLDARIGRFEELLVGRVETVASQIEVRGEAVSTAMTSRFEQLSHAIKTNTGEAEQALAQLSAALKQQTDEVESRLGAISSGTGNVLKQNAGEVERTLLGVSAEVVRSMAAKAEELNTSINQRALELARILDEKSGNFLIALGGRGQQFATDVDRVTKEAVQSIETKGLSFTKTMLDNSQDIARIINDAASTASASVTRSLENLQAGAKTATEHSQQTATAAVSEVMDTHNMLRNDTAALFERLREANILLQEVLSGATANLGAVENTLSGRVKEFVTTMNQLADRSGATSSKVEEQINSFHNITGNVLREITAVAEQFDEHGRALASAAELIDTSNRRTEQTLAERRSSMEGLVGHLDGKAQELDQRLVRFATLLKDSFEAAEGRAREIAQVIAESTAEGSRAITSQYELVRSTSEQERQRTGEALRGLYDQATGDTQTLFRQVSERFAEIVRDMKGMAGEIQHELDKTRAEVRRGVLELPQEAAESTAQMRRVIVEQIDALAELNRIVARHSHAIDTAEPVRRGVRDEVAAGGARSEPRPAARLEVVGGGGRAAPAAPPRRPPEGPASPPPQGNGRNGRDGWMSELLARASRDEEGGGKERPTRHALESLDSLSVDIARMIDHDAAGELWDRYKRGERNVFTKRLYTMQGQKTFDEIRKRYRGDRDFKQTVDRYIGEFERLLEDISRDDRGAVVARTYLTSETGKVYTMLAHAAGRFE